jgi:molybdate transport system permease protein
VTQARWFGPLLCAALAVALCFLTLPIVAIFVDTGPGDLLASLGDPAALDALTLSLWTSAVSVTIIVLVGTPAAYLLATRSFRGRSVIITLIELPLVLPPAVAGIGLLAALGPNGLLGQTLDDAGLRVVLTTASVVLALTFVAAPFYLRQAEAAFGALDPSWLEASRTLGAGEATTFVRVAIPAAMPGLIAGLALAWGRALGEFGATLMFAGSFRGVTQTVPLAIYERFATDFTAALGLSAVLVAVSAAILLTVKLATRGSEARVLAR